MYDYLLPVARSYGFKTRTHISFVLHKQKLLCAGIEQRNKTHTLAQKYGYKYPTIHSELDAYNKLTRNERTLPLVLVNARVSVTGKIGMARPCKYCMGWVDALFDEIWYTNEEGVLVKHEAHEH